MKKLLLLLLLALVPKATASGPCYTVFHKGVSLGKPQWVLVIEERWNGKKWIEVSRHGHWEVSESRYWILVEMVGCNDCEIIKKYVNAYQYYNIAVGEGMYDLSDYTDEPED